MENNSKISSLHRKFLTALTNSYLILISLFIIFGRSLSGIYIFSFRLAELIVGFLVIFSLILVIVQPKNIRNFNGFQYQFKSFLLLLTLFLISLYTNQGNLLDVYSYRSSSYIWTISIIFFSFILLNNSDTKKYHKYIFSISLPITYFFSTIHYPKIFMNFF